MGRKNHEALMYYRSLYISCFIASFLGLLSVSLYAQTDSIQLDSFIVSSERPNDIPALKSMNIDVEALELSKNDGLGEVLQNYTPAYIKDYGANGIQTITFRGMGASHTKIFLNGLDISPSSLGQTDLSIVPAYLLGTIGLKFGNAAFTEGPGALGGGVMLTDKQSLSKGWSGNAGVAIGSFNKRVLTAQLGFRKKKWQSTSRFIFQTTDNNFSYRNIAKPGDPIETITHGEGTLSGFSQSLKFLANGQNVFGYTLVLNWSDRNIPALMTSYEPSSKNQVDELVINQFSWKNYGKKAVSNLVIGYTWSKLNYTDVATSIDNTTINRKFQVREDYKYRFGERWSWNTLGSLTYADATSNNLENQPSMTQLVLMTGLNGHLSKYFEAGAFITPMMNDEDVRLLPMLSLAYMPFGNSDLIIGLNGSQNAQFPSLNDRYWNPGGNPELLPEESMNLELNVDFKRTIWKSDVRLRASGFYGMVDNWILWQPTDQPYWAPVNIKSVEHQGGEAQLQIRKQVGKYTALRFNGSYQFVQAVNKDVQDETLDKQLIYTPKHSGNWTIGATHKNAGINIVYNYTGERFITTDNSNWLPAYDLVNVRLSYQLPLGSDNQLDLQLDLNNVFDKEYMAVVYRAMPGFNWLFTLRYNYGKNVGSRKWHRAYSDPKN